MLKKKIENVRLCLSVLIKVDRKLRRTGRLAISKRLKSLEQLILGADLCEIKRNRRGDEL